MLKIRTHKDAFEAFLAPEKYGCVFCDGPHTRCNLCPVFFYCCRQPINGFTWPDISRSHKREIVKYIIRNCQKWSLKNIERVARKKAIALGYAFEKVPRI